MIECTAQIAKAHALLGHIEGGAPKAINAALNRTIDGVRTDATKEITETYDIKAKNVRAAMKITKSTLSTLRASAASAGSPIPLINFRVTPNKPGQQKAGTVLRASVKKSGGKPIPNGFVAKMSSGHAGVFERISGQYMKGKEPKGKAKGEMSKGREAIKELYGPSVPQMMGEAKIQKEVTEGASERFEKRIDHEIERLLGKG